MVLLHILIGGKDSNVGDVEEIDGGGEGREGGGKCLYVGELIAEQVLWLFERLFLRALLLDDCHLPK